MASSNILIKNFHLSFSGLFKIAGLLAVGLLLTSCGGEKVRTEAQYINVATEAHSAGDSRRALLELSAGIRHFPKNANLQLLRGEIFLDLEDGSAAEIAFNKAVALGYNRNLIKHEIAESWLYQRDPDKVIEKLEPEILKGSKDPLLLEVVGRAYIATRDRTNTALFTKNMNKARKYIDEAYRLNPDNTRVLITKAWLSAMMGKLDEAIGWLDKADSIVKDQRQNLAVKGELLVRQGKIDLARDVYDRLVKKFPQYPQYKLELGYTYLLKNDYVSARKWIEPIAKQYPNQLRAKYLLANISLMEKKYDAAKSLSDAVLAKIPNDLKTIIVNGASAYFLGDYENAHQKLSYFYNRTGSIPALKLLVATKLKLGEDVPAAKLLQDAGQTVENQTDTELLNLVAIASAKIGKTDVALQAYKKLTKKQPEIPSYQSNVGLLQIGQGDYDEGFKNLEKALKEGTPEKEPGQNLYTLANSALKIRQYGRAAAYIEQYKKVAGDNYKPWVMSAVLQTILKKPADARQDFDKAVEVAPDVAEVRARYAIFENMQGNHDRAIELARQALKLDPGDIGSGKLLLTDLVKQKKFDGIKNIVDHAMAQKDISGIGKLLFADYYTLLGNPQKTLNIIEGLPDAIKAISYYKIIAGKAYLRNGQPRRAVTVLESFSDGNPNNIQGLKYLLTGYLLTGNQKKYQSTLEKMDRLQPNDYGNRIELAKLYISTGKYNQAEKILDSLKTENTRQDMQKKIIRATLETNRKNFSKALTILSSLYEKYPENGNITMLYTRNLANNNQTGKAIAVSKAWAKTHPANLDVKQTLGDLYLMVGDNDNARHQYEGILASEGKIPANIEFHAHNNLAMIFLNTDQPERASDQARKALDMAPNNPAVADTYARVLMKQGKAEEAINHFNQALALLPNNDRTNRSDFSLGKAMALIQNGQKDEAKIILERLIKDDPKFSKISAVRNILSKL